MRFNLLFIPFVLTICISTSFAQLKTNVPEKIDLTFNLDAEPSVEAVGFDNPKSSWKTDYEIYIIDFAELEKLGKCGYEKARAATTCTNSTDKKLDKKIKKLAYRILKGKLSQNQLSKEENRKILRTIVLPPKAIEMFQEAEKVYEKNPTLIIYINSKLSTKNAAGAKLKKKYKTEGFYWLKFYNIDKVIEYRDLSKAKFILQVQKLEDGSLQLRVGYIHFG